MSEHLVKRHMSEKETFGEKDFSPTNIWQKEYFTKQTNFGRKDILLKEHLDGSVFEQKCITFACRSTYMSFVIAI